MTIKNRGGIFGRNPTFNEIGGTLTTAAQPNITSLGTQASNLAFASGNGIDFSATAGTGTSELFSDYEEGDWSPVVAEAGTPVSDAAYNASFTSGKYVKTGDLVTVTSSLRLTSKGSAASGSSFTIDGLPFTVENSVGCRPTFSVWLHGAGDIVSSYNGTLMLFASNNTDYIQFAVKDMSASNRDALTFADVSATIYMHISGSYRAA